MSCRQLILRGIVLFAVCVTGALVSPVAFPAGAAPAAQTAIARAAAAGHSAVAAEKAAPPPSRWVAVSVATLWVKPGRTRAVDAPALANPADPRAWVTAMTVGQKLWLDGRLETQALYGTKVYVLGTSGSWSKVAVSGQPTPRNGWGYPGWVPTRQLTSRAPAAGLRTAVIRRPTAWLYGSSGLTGRVLELSYGTRLPAVGWTSVSVEVVMLGGRHLYLQRSAVALQTPGAAWPAPTGAQVVQEAKRFLGLQYLWGGTSGFAFDCSGFTHSIYGALGVTIPRDAAPQATKGIRVSSRSALQPGDLVFFQDSTGYIHHVGMYVGGGKMIHSPATGQPVRIASIYAEPYLSEYAGGRRYVGMPANAAPAMTRVRPAR
jgi:gamma-D-glutamyl-L-lysine dipeptidyl-peptidase